MESVSTDVSAVRIRGVEWPTDLREIARAASRRRQGLEHLIRCV